MEVEFVEQFIKQLGKKNQKNIYAYIYDKESDVPVGEVGYRFDDETNCIILNIIIEAKQRGNGYGQSGLVELIKVAFKNGYKELRDLIYKDSTSSHILFEKLVFKYIGDVGDSRDYRLTEKDFIEK